MCQFIARTESFVSDDHSLTGQRRAYERMAQDFTPPLPAGVTCGELKFETSWGELHVRRYEPATSRPAKGWPGMLYLHGGGFMLGSAATHAFVTAELCRRLEAVIYVPDYRLAPEHPFPAAFDDSLACWSAVLQDAEPTGLNPRCIAVAGDSAGANLATVLCLALRPQDGIQPCAQALIYPALAPDREFPSHLEWAHAPLLTLADMQACWQAYLPDAKNRHDPRVAPLNSNDLSGLPPALIAVAEVDPLRDEGIFYAQQLAAQGVDVTLYQGAGLVHGCLRALHSCDEVACMLDAAVTHLKRWQAPS